MGTEYNIKITLYKDFWDSIKEFSFEQHELAKIKSPLMKPQKYFLISGKKNRA